MTEKRCARCPSCGWRTIPTERSRALRQLTAHVMLEHSVDQQPRWVMERCSAVLRDEHDGPMFK